MPRQCSALLPNNRVPGLVSDEWGASEMVTAAAVFQAVHKASRAGLRRS